MRFATLALAGALVAPPPAPPPAPPEAAILDAAAVASRLAPSVPDREGWGRDVVAALADAGRSPAAGDVCLVLALVADTGGFGQGVRLDRDGPFDFEARLERTYGRLVAGVVGLLLRLPDPATGRPFRARFAAARTEQDIDAAFLDLLAALRSRAPALVAAAERVASRRGLTLLDLDPVRTLGPMQVAFAWASREGGTGLAPAELRARLHTRAGGLALGVRRLFAAGDDAPAFLVADYNAGPFSSRNAAFQEVVGRLAGAPLALDGDLLRYDAGGRAEADSATLALLRRLAPRLEPPLDGARLRSDLALEKSAGFVRTATWREVRALAARVDGAEPPVARLPQLVVRGPKLARAFRLRDWTRGVLGGYARCLAGGALPRVAKASAAAAASAQPPAAKNAAGGELRSQSRPKSRLAPSAP